MSYSHVPKESHLAASAVVAIALISSACDEGIETERHDLEFAEEGEDEFVEDEYSLRNDATDEDRAGGGAPADADLDFTADADPQAIQPGCQWTVNSFSVSAGASGLQDFQTNCEVEFIGAPHIMTGGCTINTNYSHAYNVMNTAFRVSGPSGLDDGWRCAYHFDGDTTTTTNIGIRMLCCGDI
jgi:hypothetical protein